MNVKSEQNCNRWREAIRSWFAEVSAGEQAAQIQDHLATCADCRQYAAELRATTVGLQRLADRPVNPSPGFRARWTQAVEDAARPRGFEESAGAFLAWCRELLTRNLRPALGVASLWILALLFRLSTPDVSPTSPATTARSPAEIARALGADQRLVAWHLWRSDPLPSAPRPTQPSQPRSQRLPARPAAQSDHLPDARGTLDGLSPNLLAHRKCPAPRPLWTT